VGNRYSGTGASSINDAGTNTIYGAQLYGEATTAHLILKPLGNVGIGTNTPNFKLEVAGTLGARLSENPMPGSDVQWDPVTREIYTVPSSLRFKENISDLEIDTSKIYQLRPVSFNPIGKTKRTFGLIAEETAEILPELVTFDAEGKPFSVNYSLLSVLLLNEMKKLKSELDQLKLDFNGVIIEDQKEITQSGIWEFLESIKQGILKIKEIITEKLSSKVIYTNELCIGQTCINEEKLKELLEKNGILNNEKPEPTPSENLAPEIPQTETSSDIE
jgi:hypothetical protein